MNLWLSPHGIWYFRKVTIMPCGRRKEIKKTLRTRDKSEAKRKVLDLLACVRSGSKTRPDNPLPSSFVEQANLQTNSNMAVILRQPLDHGRIPVVEKQALAGIQRSKRRQICGVDFKVKHAEILSHPLWLHRLRNGHHPALQQPAQECLCHGALMFAGDGCQRRVAMVSSRR